MKRTLAAIVALTYLSSSNIQTAALRNNENYSHSEVTFPWHSNGGEPRPFPVLAQQSPQSIPSKAAETKESLLLDLVEHIMANAPQDLSSIPEYSKYKSEYGRLKFSDKFSAYGHNFEVTFSLTDLAINYMVVARRMSSNNSQISPMKLMQYIAGSAHIEGIVSFIDLFADRFYLRDRGATGVVLLKAFENPYSLETGNINNPLRIEVDLTLPNPNLQRSANKFELAVIKAANIHIKNANKSPESAAEYYSAHQELSKAVGIFRRAT